MSNSYIENMVKAAEAGHLETGLRLVAECSDSSALEQALARLKKMQPQSTVVLKLIAEIERRLKDLSYDSPSPF